MRELTKKNHWYKAIFPSREIPTDNRNRRVAYKTANNSPKNKCPIPSFRITAQNSTEKDQLIHKQYYSKLKGIIIKQITLLEPEGKKQFSVQCQWKDYPNPFPIALNSLISPGKFVSVDWKWWSPGTMNFKERRQSKKESHRLDWIPNRACFRTEYAEVESWRRSLWRWRYTWRVLVRTKFHT